MNIFKSLARIFGDLFGESAPVERPTYARPEPHKYYLQRIPRFDGKGQPPAGHWAPCHPSTIARFKAQMTCTSGHSLTLANHTVAADGRVYPSIVCRTPGCAYHEIITLEGWTFGGVGTLHERRAG